MKNNNLIIAVGGNITNKQGIHPTKVCDDAINLLKDHKIYIEKQSKWYISEPIPVSSQPKYFNKVIIAKSLLNELEILNTLHLIEKKFGRVRKKVNESRMIDLDLIDCFGLILDNKNIVLPHPRAHLRRFVMEPLSEVNPNWIHPIHQISVREILKDLNTQNIQVFN
jgi:2-amino-4-hydroxy-6-hydroxymethyldihydropteridine diphosphokinase